MAMLTIEEGLLIAQRQLNSHDFPSAERIAAQILAAQPYNTRALQVRGSAILRQGRPVEAAAWLLASLGAGGGLSVSHHELGLALLSCGHPDEALRHFSRALMLDSGNLAWAEGARSALFQARRAEDSLSFGQRALEIRDHHAMKAFQEHTADFKLLETNLDGSGKLDVISMSLFGDKPRYTIGAIENVRLARLVYPGWRCRIYHDESVPLSILDTLTNEGAELVRTRMDRGPYHGTFWRFRVWSDPSVHRFLIRDVDSRLNHREMLAAEEWISSGKLFHVMRDNPCHTYLIQAGMWGGTAGVLPDVDDTLERFKIRCDNYFSDQIFLSSLIWPLIRPHLKSHDAFYRIAGSEPFPEHARLEPPHHVGEVVSVDEADPS